MAVDVFRLVRDLPTQVLSVFRILSLSGTLWAVALAVAAALVAHRPRLARDLLLAGLAAWVVAHFMAALVSGSGFLPSLHNVTHLRGVSPEFPLTRVAVVVAVVAAAAPYLTRPMRLLGRAWVLVVALAALYAGLPDDMLGGVFLGLGIAAGVHLIFGSPGGRPTSAQVTTALAELGTDARAVHLAKRQPAGATLMVGRDRHGPLNIRVIGRDEADGQLLAKLWRIVFYKDSGPTLYMSRLQEVEHSAYVTLVAGGHGVRTPQVVVAGQAGPKTAVLVERLVEGQVLGDMDAAAVSEGALVELWRQVGL
ncbi:MAG TPA: hypothetical protein VG476_09850, partial [Acidimicrobiales bacterium]|nr:hypothetical protein [Acidimicrobiales bacterium]